MTPAKPMTDEEMRVELTQGYSAIINKEDFPLISGLKWRAKRNGRTTYAISDSRGLREYMHRLILGTKEKVDHIDYDGLNNRRLNLRPISNTDNIRRKRPNLNGSSQYKGVCLASDSRGWQAMIKVDGKSKWLGCHKTEIKAAEAYDSAAVKYFGEHTYLNLK